MAVSEVGDGRGARLAVARRSTLRDATIELRVFPGLRR